MKDKIFGILQRVGRSFMLPIAILPVAGRLLGLGGSFTNETMLETYGLMKVMGPGTVINQILQVMNAAGNIVFSNLPVIFAMGVAIGMAKKEKEVAALAAVISFFIMHASIGALITVHGGAESMLSGAVADVCGITSLQMGVFGGIIVGLGVAALHNRFYKIELPQVLSFFGGTRFVPIISGIVYVGVGILMFFIWPPVQSGIYAIGNLVLNSGYFGTWIYGFMERLLIPFGLHHVFYLPFWQTGVGGTMEIGGKVIEGAQNIFFAQLSDPTVTKFSVSATRFMSGKFPLMIFGLPGAALAMYKTADNNKKKAVSGLLLSAALTSMLTGITEPLEFTFLFVAPLLYGIHCVMAGFAYMIMHMLNVGVGMTFSGGLIDMFLFGVMQGNKKTNWLLIIVVGIIYFIVYYFVFSFLIKKYDLKTPGRLEGEEVKLYTKSDYNKKNKETGEDELLSEQICKGLGGRQNVSDIDCCATRLRCTVVDAGMVDDELLKSTGASGVVHKGNGVQIIYGPRVTIIKTNLEEYMQKPSGEIKKEKSKKRGTIILSPMTGIAADIETAPDEAFSGKMMGDGVVVTPTKPMITSPVNGKVSFIFDTKHAIGLITEDGLSLIIHVGIDTVSLKGEGFDILVNNGQKIKKGDMLMKLDLNFLAQNAASMVSPIICPELNENQTIRLLKKGKIKAGEELFEIITED